MNARRGICLAALSLCGLGCGAEAPGERTDVEAQRIVAGEPSGSDQDGVVLLRAVLEDKSELLCSASLVGPNLVMTARHCVAYMTEGPFSCSQRGELIDNPTGGGRLGLDLPAASFEIYSGKTPRKSPLAHGLQIVSTLPPTVCENDIAFVVLDTALDLPVLPLRLGRPAEPHEPVVLVGYGTETYDQLINYKTQPRQQKRGLKVAAVGADSLDDGVTTVPPRVVILESPSGCLGDSGGPLLAESTGAVLGVYSLQRGSSCAGADVRNQLVHVPAFSNLIAEAFATAGCEPVLEPTPAEGGGGEAGAATGATGNDPDEPNVASGGAGGAAGEASSEPELTRPPAKSSGCSVAAARGDDADVVDIARVVALLGFAALARRRRASARDTG